jgi:hypothetical protein
MGLWLTKRCDMKMGEMDVALFRASSHSMTALLASSNFYRFPLNTTDTNGWNWWLVYKGKFKNRPLVVLFTA